MSVQLDRLGRPIAGSTPDPLGPYPMGTALRDKLLSNLQTHGVTRDHFAKQRILVAYVNDGPMILNANYSYNGNHVIMGPQIWFQ